MPASGYTHCRCRDCFTANPDYCNECLAHGCDTAQALAKDGSPVGSHECQRPGAYGGEELSR